MKSTADFTNGTLKRIMVDFEKAVWKAVKDQIPTVEIVGCHFHHKSAIRRNVQDKGLQSLYGNEVSINYLLFNYNVKIKEISAISAKVFSFFTIIIRPYKYALHGNT